MGDRMTVHTVVCYPWARAQVSAASIARGRFRPRGMYCTCLETSQESCWLPSLMSRWGCCPFQAPCCFRFSYSLEVTSLRWSERSAQFLVSLNSWRVLAPETEYWWSSRVTRGVWVVVLTDLWAEPWRPCKVFPMNLRPLTLASRSNTASCYAW